MQAYSYTLRLLLAFIQPVGLSMVAGWGHFLQSCNSNFHSISTLFPLWTLTSTLFPLYFHSEFALPLYFHSTSTLNFRFHSISTYFHSISTLDYCFASTLFPLHFHSISTLVLLLRMRALEPRGVIQGLYSQLP